jgi:hypothetical protein
MKLRNFLTFMVILITLAGHTTHGLGQEDSPADPDSTQSASVLFPVLGYTPDTKVMFGATWLRFFQIGEDKNNRPSLFSPALVVTTKKQLILFLGSEYYWGGGKNHAQILPSFMRFPDQFFGVGRTTSKDNEESYTPEQFALELQYDRKVLDALALGVTYQWANHSLVETESGGLLESGLYAGTEKTVLSAPGLLAVYDSRDNTFAARRGNYSTVRFNFIDSAFGSDYTLTETVIDLRHYVPIGGAGSLAFQANIISQDGDAPFFKLPRLGGFDGMRGYMGGRYTDQARFFVRTEWRTYEFWKGLGATVFAGYGDVAPAWDKLSTAAELYTVGFGLRYTLNAQEQVKVRMDMGFGNGDQGFYLGLGEAF